VIEPGITFDGLQNMVGVADQILFQAPPGAKNQKRGPPFLQLFS
jgi:hypothetical protein